MGSAAIDNDHPNALFGCQLYGPRKRIVFCLCIRIGARLTTRLTVEKRLRLRDARRQEQDRKEKYQGRKNSAKLAKGAHNHDREILVNLPRRLASRHSRCNCPRATLAQSLMPPPVTLRQVHGIFPPIGTI